MRVFAPILCVLIFGACSDISKNSLIPSAKDSNIEQEKRLERKIQASRKGEIMQGKYTPFVAIATYLNDVDNINAKREVFLVELYEKKPDSKIQDKLSFDLISHNVSMQSLFVTRLNPNQYTDILRPKNPYNALFVVEFESISKKHRETMKLKLTIKDEGAMSFDFGYPVLKSKLRWCA